MDIPETAYDDRARRLIGEALDDSPPPARPGVAPHVAELLARHADEAREARRYPSTQSEPDPKPAPQSRPAEPTPGWAKGAALVAPAVGGGIWLSAQGVSSVMSAVSAEVVAGLLVAALVVWLAGRTAAKRGPRKVVTHNDYTGARIDNRTARWSYRSNNG